MSFSNCTIQKQELFFEVLDEFAIKNKDKKIHITDLNTFQLIYWLGDTKIFGSAAIAERVLTDHGCDFTGVTYEEDRENYAIAVDMARKHGLTKFVKINGDNKQFVDYPVEPGRKQFIYYDPNNIYKGDVDLLANYGGKHPTADIMLLIGAGNLKRPMRKFGHPRPFEIIDPLIKMYTNVYISADHQGSAQWSLVLFTNDEYNLNGFCKLSDPIGKIEYYTLNYTSNEIDLWLRQKTF